MVDEIKLREGEGRAGPSASENPDTGRVLAQARAEGAFAMTTADPAFDPSRAVTVNGYGFVAVTPMVNAARLMAEAAGLLRGYEKHHRARLENYMTDPESLKSAAAIEDLNEKIDRNAGMAQRLEDFLLLDTTPRDTLTGLALSLVQDIDELIGNSQGVAGLHRNGDVAPWASLTEGGKFEALLGSFDRLRDALDGVFPPREHPNYGDNAPCSCASGAQGAPVDASCPVHGLPDDNEEPSDPAAVKRTMEAAISGGLLPAWITLQALTIAPGARK